MVHVGCSMFAQWCSGRKQILPMIYRSIHLTPKNGCYCFCFSLHTVEETQGKSRHKIGFCKQTPGRTMDEMSLFKVSVSSNVIVDTLNVAIVVTLIRVV